MNDEEKSKEAIYKALTKTENKRKTNKQIIFNENNEYPVAKAIASAPDIEATKKYASYSSKAIHKLLQLMRCGKYHTSLDKEITILSQGLHEEQDEKSQKKITEEINRINRIKERATEIYQRLEAINFNAKRIHEIADDDVQKQLLKSFINKKDDLLDAKGLNTYQACYLVYDRHSERSDDRKYSQPSEFNIMEQLPNNSLRNPVVEQVIREALFVVKDVWEKYGQPDEIHIEMGRDLKKNAKEREKATNNSKKNYEEKQQIKKLLYELLNDGFEQYENDGDEIKKVAAKFEVKPNPNNPSDIDRFRIWKSISGLRDADFEKKVKDEKIPKNQEIKKYALWLSQRCASPYTGRIIPLSKLFDQSLYEIEHVLPKAKIKNDSFENLIISERGVNKAKGNELAAIFIKSKNGGCEFQGTKYKLLDYPSYVEHCKKTFRGKKLQNLLATEIPDDFITRQINDTRYITKKISELLYPVAKDKDAGIVFTIGAITSELKKEWGLQKEWKKLIKPRFERLEKINNAKYILKNKKDENDIDFHIPENPDLDTKRIDHRHHALDAIIIAATTREHIRYLNTLNAADTDEEFKKARLTLVKGKIREWALPWESFTKEAKEKLEQTVVTFKSYNKVIDKPKNIYTKFEPVLDSNGEQLFSDNGKTIPLFEKKEVKQVKPTNGKQWISVRQSLFAEQPHGKVYMKEIIEKSFETPNQMLEIIKLQIEREKAQNTPLQMTASYIYDKDTRELVKKKIAELKGDVKEIEKQLKNFKPKNFKGELITKVRIAEFNPYAAKRKEINRDFDHKVIDKIPYAEKEKSKIPNALHNHLLEYEQKKLEIEKLAWRNNRLERLVNDVKFEPLDLKKEETKKLIKEAQSEAFSDEGLESLDKKIGMKIRMVTLIEDIGIKIPLKNKYSEADGNPYFIMYENIDTKERSDFASLSSYDIIQRMKNGEPIAEKKEGQNTIILQPNDLVYLPEVNREGKVIEDISKIDWGKPTKEMINKIYIIKSFSKYQIFFIPAYVSSPLDKNSNELDNNNKSETAWTNEGWATVKDKKSKQEKDKGLMIKEYCIKLKIDRLGNIKPADQNLFSHTKNKRTEGIPIDKIKNKSEVQE